MIFWRLCHHPPLPGSVGYGIVEAMLDGTLYLIVLGTGEASESTGVSGTGIASGRLSPCSPKFGDLDPLNGLVSTRIKVLLLTFTRVSSGVEGPSPAECLDLDLLKLLSGVDVGIRLEGLSPAECLSLDLLELLSGVGVGVTIGSMRPSSMSISGILHGHGTPILL